jgi:hypothetical protein
MSNKKAKPATAAPTAPYPISQAEFSRLAKRSKSRISEDCREGRPLAPACLLDRTIDLRHPAVKAWAVSRKINPAQLMPSGAQAAASTPRDPPGPAPAPASACREEFDALTLRKKLAETIRIEVRNARDAGRLISRELVQAHVFGYLDRLHRQLLGPVAQTLSVRLRAAVNSGASDAELQATIRQLFSSELQEAKRGARNGITAATRVARSNEELPDVKDDLPATE